MKSQHYFIIMFLLASLPGCEIMPYNTIADCQNQCPDTSNPKACIDFCECIHQEGQPLDSCLANYERAKDKQSQVKEEVK